MLPGSIGSALLALGAAGVFCLVGDRSGDRYVPVVLRRGENRVCLTALRDTGNTLTDPVTGQPVLVVDGNTCASITGLTREQLRAPLEAITQLPGSRLIPYRAVGQPAGFLLALRLPEVRIGAWKGSCLVAFAPDGLDNREFQGLTGGMV